MIDDKIKREIYDLDQTIRRLKPSEPKTKSISERLKKLRFDITELEKLKTVETIDEAWRTLRIDIKHKVLENEIRQIAQQTDVKLDQI